MIGAPTNFQHTGHIGTGDLDMASAHLNAIQNQMQGKGGYEASFGVKVPAIYHSARLAPLDLAAGRLSQKRIQL
jgi:hypothetical protein